MTLTFGTKHIDWYELQVWRKDRGLEPPKPPKLSIEQRVLILVRIICHLCGHPDLAEDLSQDILLRLLEKNEYRGEASLETWLSKVIRHALFRMLKKCGAGRQDELSETLQDKRSEEAVLRINKSIDSDRLLSALIKSNPGLERRVITLIIEAENDEISRREVVRQLQETTPEITRHRTDIAMARIGKVIQSIRRTSGL